MKLLDILKKYGIQEIPNDIRHFEQEVREYYTTSKLTIPMKAYKLIRKMKDGQLSPLFINQTSRIPVGEWMTAEFHPRKGFAPRQGWHCTLTPNAPHLSEKGRVWTEVEIDDFEYYDRPESQGGTWVLAQRMRIIKELNK